MNSSAETLCRVQAPNSMPRQTCIVALDIAGEDVVQRLATRDWRHTLFFTAVDAALHGPGQGTSTSVVRDCSRRSRDFARDIAATDLVVMVAGPGGSAHAVSLIGEMCRRHQVMTTGLIVDVEPAGPSALSKTLTQVRPWSLMVVIAHHDDDVDDLLTALRVQ